jgi:hypothetical protein
MKNPIRMAVAIAAAALVVALIAWARGNPHHHGLDIGSLGQSHVVALSAANTHR